jgi:hypothetical protein
MVRLTSAVHLNQTFICADRRIKNRLPLRPPNPSLHFLISQMKHTREKRQGERSGDRWQPRLRVLSSVSALTQSWVCHRRAASRRCLKCGDKGRAPRWLRSPFLSVAPIVTPDPARRRPKWPKAPPRWPTSASPDEWWQARRWTRGLLPGATASTTMADPAAAMRWAMTPLHLGLGFWPKFSFFIWFLLRFGPSTPLLLNDVGNENGSMNPN